MEDQLRPESSADLGEASALPSPRTAENERPRPRAVVMPNILVPSEIIRPVSAAEQIIQVAMLSVNHGQYHIVRTGALVIDPASAGARDPSLPVPVTLPNASSIAGVATVLPLEMIKILLPNLSTRHHGLLLDLEREEDKVFDLRARIRELERRHPTTRTARAWAMARRALDPDLGQRLPQAIEYERFASVVNRRPDVSASFPSEVEERHRSRRRVHQFPMEEEESMFSSEFETCRMFFVGLRFLSPFRPSPLEGAVRLLIQLIVDDVLSPAQFCERLERLLDARPQPNIVRFLEDNMREMRQALYMNHATLEGIDRPSFAVAFPLLASTPEFPEYSPVADPPGPVLPMAAVEPQQEIPLSAIPYDLPLPLDEIHVSQVEKSGLPSLIRTELREGDLHLYSPRVGYVHFRVMPTTTSFQIGDTTVRLV